MSRFQTFSLTMAISGAFLFSALCVPSLHASATNEKTIFRFSEPVEVPGMVLPAGKYVFKLDQGVGDLNIVQIENPAQNRTYGLFLVTPDYRWKAPRRPGVTFEQRVPGAPRAIRAWFYPGDQYGNEFVYPK